jgi:hypothetical protein
MRRYNTVSFGWQFLAAAAGALADFCVGKLTNKLSLAVFGWLVATLAVSAILALFADETAQPRQRQRPAGYVRASLSQSLSRWFTVYLNQSRSRAVWPSIVNAAGIAFLATVTYGMLTLALIVMRYAGEVRAQARWLGKGSPFDNLVVTEALKYQFSHTALNFAIAALLIALLLRPPFVLPAGIIAVCAINGFSLSLPRLSAIQQDPPTQLIAPVSWMDDHFLQLRQALVVPGCIGILLCGLLLCEVIHRRIGAKSRLAWRRPGT